MDLGWHEARIVSRDDLIFRGLPYASETNKTASMWRAIPDDLLDFKPHEKVNTIRAILVHQILSERRFFAQFVGTVEPPVEELLPPGDQPPVQAYLDRYIGLAKLRLPQLAEASAEWWLTGMPFFGGLRRQRIWTFWRRSPPYLPPSDPDPDLAASGGSARPGDLRTIGRCEMGRGRSDLFAGSGETGRMSGFPARQGTTTSRTSATMPLGLRGSRASPWAGAHHPDRRANRSRPNL